MMRLRAEWLQPTRPKDQVILVQKTMEDSILNFFDGVEGAKKSHELYCKLPKSPMSDWSRAVNQGYRAVQNIITPHEYAALKIKLTFT